jgi:uncharacterized membrane protein
MRELPVDAKAICTDGEVGWVTDVVVDSAKRSVTHIVVRENETSAREFLVPLDQVTESSRAAVRLNFARAGLTRFAEFTTTHYVPASSPEAQPVVAEWEMQAWTSYYGYEPIYAPVVSPDMQVPVDEHHVPEGELAFERGTPVQSNDEELMGEVVSFLTSPEDGTITHFAVQLDATGSPREVILPLSTVSRANDGIVHLTLNRKQLEQLPAVPPGGRYSPAGSNPDALELLSIVFDGPTTADDALNLIKDMKPKIDAAVVRKSADGSISTHEPHDMSARGGAVRGAVIGGVLGVLGGPLGLVAAAAIGGAAGGAVGGVVDRGIPDRYTRDLGRALHASSSALVVLVPHGSEAALMEQLSSLNGNVLRLELTDEMIARLTQDQ